MKLSDLLHRPAPELPGLVAVARVDRRADALARRAKPGEIAVIDQLDLDRATADALIAAGVIAVVNAAQSITGRYPNLGPSALVSSGVLLVDTVGPEIMHAVKDGMRLRISDGVLFAGKKRLGDGIVQDADSVADAMVEAKSGLSTQLEAFAGNTIEFMRRERAMLLDGHGVPDVDVAMAGRHVLVVAAGFDHAEQLARLRHYIRECKPVLVGVGAGADALLAAGYTPQLIVGNPAGVSNAALGCGADVVVPADLDGHAPGLHRVQDLGAGAVTFPSSANTEDMALLLAAHGGAELVVTVGLSASMAEFLDRSRATSNASTFLTRLQVGGTLVDGSALATLYRSRVPVGVVWLMVLAAVAVGLSALLVSDAGDAVLSWLAQLWTGVLAGSGF
ncbi:putative cytokinetic ring protein SteA [Pseudonocardia humida]|uniref:Thiamine pyrophosphokinase n=1 Tax=Pseudonocardia humida TaxID=2800819 RepID=A0ABT1ACZ6_9PSEU|nr:putative cytokinetic ring protein SteA [Pseudonocardia humida]MCO1660771.1 thiamine pyrophosphokinase [Pseudonocardia humida]